MVTIYFCRDDYAPVTRHWPYVPRIGDRIALPEFGGSENQFSVYKVVCEGDDDPTISIYLHPDLTERDGRFSANGHAGSRDRHPILTSHARQPVAVDLRFQSALGQPPRPRHFFCHYNYCRKHKSLKGMTPAVAHGLSTEVWSVRKMLERVTA